jgi:hypothetical protein
MTRCGTCLSPDVAFPLQPPLGLPAATTTTTGVLHTVPRLRSQDSRTVAVGSVEALQASNGRVGA